MKILTAFVAIPLFLGCSVQVEPQAPYAGQEARDIKALSSSEIADLQAGKGMGFAKPAELNGFPGPAHVLQLSAQLNLSPKQRTQTHAIFMRMESSAKLLGAELVEAERALDASFQNRRVNAESLSRSLDAIGPLQAKVRNVHLHAHLEQTSLLTAAQVAHYNKLRGYSTDGASHKPHAHGDM